MRRDSCRSVPTTYSPPASLTWSCSAATCCLIFSVREGRLEAKAADAPEHKPASVFEKVGEDLDRTTAGRETGELLRITRDEHGDVVKMNWATYLFARKPLAFGEQP
jgi:hypothetical protein